MRIRFLIYRNILRIFVKFFRFFFIHSKRYVLHSKDFSKLFNESSTRICCALKTKSRDSEKELLKRTTGRLWFHAASAGELESLWTLICSSYLQGKEIILTVFSESAMSEVEKLKSVLSQITKSQDNKISNEESHSKNSRLKSKPLLKINSEEISGEIKRNSGKLLFCGLSPWEGEWSESLEKMLPDLFITAKYEAWPEIWCALSLLRIPLCIIGAKKRTSLMLAKKICYFLKIPLPQMILIPGTDSDTLELRELFPRATLQTAPDPRWDRIFERSKHNSLRVQKRISEFSLLPRPWGMLGQVWLSDFKIWDSLLKKVSGTIWIIPHSLDPRIVDQMKEFLSTRGLLETVDSVGRRLQPRCLFIAEMGLLAELYSVADWVYVGGGFGKGVHNTMEPAIYGVPIAIGPKGQNGFSEIEELKKQKQLTVVRDSVMLDFWLQNINKHTSQDRKYWKESALILRGGTKKIDSLLSLVTRNV